MKVGDKVKVIGGIYEIDQPTMINKIGTISSIGFEYTVKGKKTKEVFVDFKHFGGHLFNDYHLQIIKELE